MASRSVPSLAPLIGVLAVLVGVVGLERVFVSERRDALDALAARRAALRGYAVLDLQARCQDEMEAQRPRLHAALESPLIDGSGLLYLRNGRQLLPRQFAFVADPPSAKPLVGRLTSGEIAIDGLDEDDPWSTRLRFLASFRDALDRGSRAEIETTFRAILTHRVRFAIDSRKDLPFQVALLELLTERSRADPVLMEKMLRDGLTDSRGTHMPGLQIQLLARREKLVREDFEFLAERVLKLSEQSGVRHDDFRERVAETSAASVAVPERVTLPILAEHGAWMVQPSGGSDIEGVAVDLAALLSRARGEMLKRGLLEEEDILSLAELPDGPLDFQHLRIEVESPRWERNRVAIQRRFWLKTGLAVTLAGVLLAAGVVWSAWTRREGQLLALKAGFVSTVSHELRTPLASMRLMAETLERRLGGMDPARDYPRRLIREIDSLSFLVENILSFNRLEKGRWKPQVEDVPVSELARLLREELPGTTQARVEVELEGGSDLVVRADPELMKLLFLNLGSNACKYNQGELVTIRIEAAAGHPLVIRVADNGIGIPGEQIEEIFSEFYRGERGGRGFGLGLAICRRIMELHAGQIRVADSSASGTVFEMSFP